ncbi:MAG TPA: TonB-dependent receptor [Gemmatimonadales bacterium]
MTSRISLRAAVVLAALLGSAGTARAQAAGAISGKVTDAESGRPVVGALVTVSDGRRGNVTDTSGAYRIREVRSGTYSVYVRAIGYAPIRRDNLVVQAGSTTLADFSMRPSAVEVAPIVVETADPVLDPLRTATEQTVTAEDLRTLPVSSLEEALALSAGAVGESYRGGRLGQESFIIDGLGVKNQLDASTGSLGIRLPPDILTEAALVTNGFSARYGQALSGLINVVTRDGGEAWSGRVAYETDRPFGDGWDYGLDRAVVAADGPLVGGIRAVVAADVNARLDAEPVSAPAPDNPLDPRFDDPHMLPHNGGEQYNFAGKLTIPIGGRQTLRLFGLRSIDQRQLFDPAYKYDSEFGPSRRTAGTLASAHLQHATSPTSGLPLIADLRVALFSRDFSRGTLAEQPDYRFGAFTGEGFSFVGEDIARAQDTVAAQSAIPGLVAPLPSSSSPWGVPGFFLADGSRGELAWNQFREVRSQLDLTFGAGQTGDIFAGVEVVSQRVRTFQRALGYLPVGHGDSVPPATASEFTPLAGAAYLEGAFRVSDLGITAGLRYDRFDTRSDLPGSNGKAQSKFNPRIAVSTVLKGATFVASIGRFSQAPDYQYLVDAAFDDTTRTGRFRQGNPNLGFEGSWQYEFSLRARPRPGIAVRVNAFVKRLEGLVSSVPLGVDPDSSIFGNSDNGTVRGGEVLFEREMRGGWGVRASYTLQQALATSTSAFLLRRVIRIDSFTGDTIIPAKVEFPLDYDRRHNLTLIVQGQVPASAGPKLLGVHPLSGLEAALITRISSGLPFTRFRPGTDTLVGEPNSARLPTSSSVDMLLRRPLTLGGMRGSVYMDVRNLLGRRNVVAVRRDTGEPSPDIQTIETMAQDAFERNPDRIPYESPRYRTHADVDGNGYVEGPELLEMYRAAARDLTQPIFAYGAPRLARVGIEILF